MVLLPAGRYWCGRLNLIAPSDLDAVAWGSWMVADLTPELEFEIQKSRQQISRARPDELRAMAADTYQAWLMQSVILRQACRRIAELECKEALALRQGPRWRVKRWWRWATRGIRGLWAAGCTSL